MYIEDLMSIPLLHEMIEHGYVKRQFHPEDRRYQILNYTDKAIYDKVWNEVTLQCRGLILFGEENAYKIVEARPFKKFFNYGESNADTFDMDEPVAVFDKVDGSLGILYTAPDGRHAIATRGSFDSFQARHATKVYREKYEGKWDPTPGDVTYLFEIVFPQNRIVLDYGQQDDLVLLGTVDIETGSNTSPEWAQVMDGWPGPVAQRFIHPDPSRTLTFADALAMPPRENAEGFVVSGVGKKVKIKQEDYLLLHRIIFGLTEKAVWEGIGPNGSISDFAKGLPDEFHGWVNTVANRLRYEAAVYTQEVEDTYRHLRGTILNAKANRPDFAREALKYPYSGLLFMLLDDKDISQKVWEHFKPEHVPFYATNNDDSPVYV